MTIQLTMQSIKHKLEQAELQKVPNVSGKAAFLKSFDLIITTENKLTGQVKG